MVSEKQVNEHNSVEKWTELKIGDKMMSVYLEKPLMGDFEDHKAFILDARSWKMLKWGRSDLFLKYK